MIYLENLNRTNKKLYNTNYPFCIDIIKNLQEIIFEKPITILIGENGAGKSTLLEIIASKLNCTRVSDRNIDDDVEFEAINKAASYFRASISHRSQKNFFLRAEDFKIYIRNLRAMKDNAQAELNNLMQEYEGRSDYAKELASMPYKSTIYSIEHMYDNDLEKRSQGESALDFFCSRINSNGLYLIDEPETSLSFQSQLALLKIIKEAVDNDSQFIIATHSPVIASFPDAQLLEISGSHISAVKYDDIENFLLLRDFLNKKERYLQHLL